MGCGVSHRCGLDLALLWLWRRLAAIALIRPLAWEPPYAEGVALEKAKRQKKKKKEKKKEKLSLMFLRFSPCCMNIEDTSFFFVVA